MDGAAASAQSDLESRLRALIMRAGNDPKAYALFLILVAERLRPFFRNRLRQTPFDVEDLVQETLLALHTRRAAYDPSMPVLAWVYAIARYKLIDHFRRTGLRVHVPIDAVSELAAPETANVGDAEREVDGLLSQLSANQQESIRLVKLKELSILEASAASGMSTASIKVNIHRGLNRLAALVRGEKA